MAAGITISTIFANEAGNQPAAQLDTCFAQGVSALNNLTTFSNYYVDTGIGGAIAIAVPSPQVATIAAGLAFQIKVAANNSGSVSISVNGGAAVAIAYPGSFNSPLANQIVAGAIISVVHDGTRYQYLGPIFGNGTATVTLTGCTTSPTGTLAWSVSNGQMFLEIPSVTGTSNAVAMTMTGLPSFLIPARQQNCAVPDSYCRDNGANVGGATSSGAAIQLNPSSSIITFSKNGSSNGWTNGGSKGTTSEFTVACNLT